MTLALVRWLHEAIVPSAPMTQLWQHSDVLRALRNTRQRVADNPYLVLEDYHMQRSKAPV